MIREFNVSTRQIAPVTTGFESLKQTNEHNAEYWSARDLQPMLGYSQWRRFEQAIERAMASCEASGNKAEHHFAGAGKPIMGGKGAVQVVEDYHLSRFACYLIAQNGDPRKPEIAYAQQYFAVQARRQELSDQATADVERLELRKQTAEEFKALSGAAQDAGVQSKMFGVFHDAGYKGMYGVIEPATRAAGYEPLRIDSKQHNGKIDDEIMASIRASRFVVSDFTGNRGGVYYEAGFAHGLGLPVIFMCREGDELHFDIRQYNCIFWKPENFEDAQSQLKNRILATLGQGPKFVQ